MSLNRSNPDKKNVLSFTRAPLTVLCLVLALLWGSLLAGTAAASEEKISGLKEGWSWPVVVIPPPEGWDSEKGRAIKVALRMAEREISTVREAIRGFEVEFMFPQVSDTEEIGKRLHLWRAMKANIILSFAGGDVDRFLARECGNAGPSVIFAGGEDLSLRNAAGKVQPYLFALDLYKYYKANAFTEVAKKSKPIPTVAIYGDALSAILARGAEHTRTLMDRDRIPNVPMWLAALQQDEFVVTAGEARSIGAQVYLSWLDGMATLSIWKTVTKGNPQTQVWYVGERSRFILDAQNTLLCDQHVLLERNIIAQKDFGQLLYEIFGVRPTESLLACRAYTLGRWAIASYVAVGTNSRDPIAKALAQAKKIPLLDEWLDIDYGSHRPVKRKIGILKVQGREFANAGAVDVFSARVLE